MPHPIRVHPGTVWWKSSPLSYGSRQTGDSGVISTYLSISILKTDSVLDSWKIFLLFTKEYTPILGPTKPPIHWVPVALFLEVGRTTGHEVDY